MRSPLLPLGLTAMFVSVVGATPVNATAYCVIGKVKTGFVALREQPSPKGTLLAKIKTGEEVRLSQETKGKWVKIDYWAKGRFPNGEKAEVPPTHTGWAHSSLVGTECG